MARELRGEASKKERDAAALVEGEIGLLDAMGLSGLTE